MTATTRTARLRAALNESQEEFGRRIGASQGTVWRLEAGQAETGPQRLLLDQIERQLAAGGVGACDAALPSPAADEVAS